MEVFAQYTGVSFPCWRFFVERKYRVRTIQRNPVNSNGSVERCDVATSVILSDSIIRQYTNVYCLRHYRSVCMKRKACTAVSEKKRRDIEMINRYMEQLLPIDIQCYIFSYLSTKTKIQLNVVSKCFEAVLRSPKIHLSCDISGIRIPNLQQISRFRVTDLNISWCFVRNKELSHLSVLPLTKLDMTHCHGPTDAGIAHLAGLPLTSLDLSYVAITDAGLAHLSSLPLTSLFLRCSTYITAMGLSHLSSLPLTNLDLFECNSISDDGMSHISSLPLNKLNLDSCLDITDEGTCHLSSLPLTNLDLSSCRVISDVGISHILSLSLTNLRIYGSFVSDIGMLHLSSLPLTSLDIGACRYITDAGLSHLSKLPLTALSIGHCAELGTNITDAGLIHLSTIPLKYLCLHSCENITNAGLLHLSKLPLTNLDISGDTGITDAGILHLSSLPLIFLNLNWSTITDKGLVLIATLQLTYLEIYSWYTSPNGFSRLSLENPTIKRVRCGDKEQSVFSKRSMLFSTDHVL